MISDNRIEGFKAWIEYALQNNPNIKFLLLYHKLIFQMQIRKQPTRLDTFSTNNGSSIRNV